MRCFSLFSGIGGFDLAAERESHELVGACEIDKHARQIYQRHFPKVRQWDDATKINPGELPDFDLLCAGFPCQTFSTAGNKLGFEESRGTLFFEAARIAKQKRPQFILLENVKGLLSHDNGKTISTILATLDELGYDAEWQVINSKYFVPQNRERIFIIGHLRGKPLKQVFPITKDGRLCNDEQKEADQVCNALQGGGHSGGLHSQMTMVMLSQQKGNIKQRVQTRENTWSLDTSNNYFAVETSSGYRRLTPLECERLQGFPDGWTEGISDTQRFKCLGNAVTVPVIQHILQCLTLDRNSLS